MGRPSAGAAEKVTTKVADLRPKGSHVTRDIAFGPDGTLYLALGSRDNISDFKPGAQVFKINADGSMSEFASGLRNPVGIAFYPGTNTLYVTTNERDGLGDDLPPDYLTSVKPGGFYGYPYAYIGKNPDPVWGAKDPGGKIQSSITPDVLFHAHSRAAGTGFLYRHQLSRRVSRRCFCLPARLVELGQSHWLQGGAGALPQWQAGQWL